MSVSIKVLPPTKSGLPYLTEPFIGHTKSLLGLISGIGWSNWTLTNYKADTMALSTTVMTTILGVL